MQTTVPFYNPSKVHWKILLWQDFVVAITIGWCNMTRVDSKLEWKGNLWNVKSIQLVCIKPFGSIWYYRERLAENLDIQLKLFALSLKLQHRLIFLQSEPPTNFRLWRPILMVSHDETLIVLNCVGKHRCTLYSLWHDWRDIGSRTNEGRNFGPRTFWYRPPTANLHADVKTTRWCNVWT